MKKRNEIHIHLNVCGKWERIAILSTEKVAATLSPQGEKATAKNNFRSDLLASLVVFLVAVPLALGISLASGAPSVVPGLIACAVGGIVVGMLGGSKLQVSGPAAGLTVIVYGMIHKFGWPVTCAITVFAGLFQIGFGFARVARVCLSITPAVVHGMLAGIGVVIALSQAHIILGGTPESNALANLRELPGQIADLHGHSTILGLMTIAVLFGWLYVPKKLKLIPGALVAVLITTLISNLEWFDVKRVDLPSNIASAFALPQLPSSDYAGFLIAALTIALVASVESLLSAIATDKMHTAERADLDRELIGQGAANAISGLIGGLPITGVIVRSATNVNAGAKTRLSAVMHGVWIIAFVALFSPLIERVPLSALAGLLVFVGIRLINFKDIRELVHHREAVIYFVTLLGVAFWNLLAGVGLGIALSVMMLLKKLARTVIQVEQKNDRWHVRIEGSLTFISVPELTVALAKIPAGTSVDVDLMAEYLDHGAFEALHGWRVTHEKMGGKVDIDEKHEVWYENAVQGKPSKAKSVGAVRLGVALKTILQGKGKRDMRDLAAGVAEFNATAPTVARPLFEKLARDGQHPTVLFIGCCDSRMVPHLITNTEPGDMFKLRNIGNMVPPYEEIIAGKTDNSVLATLEYALEILHIENIIVCGHSECGAMQALLDNPTATSDKPGLGAWLKHGERTLRRFQNAVVLDSREPASTLLAQTNVIQQLDNLQEYPLVRQRLEDGRLHLWGWFFNIAEAQLMTYSLETRSFVKIDSEVAQTMVATRTRALPQSEAVGAGTA